MLADLVRFPDSCEVRPMTKTMAALAVVFALGGPAMTGCKKNAAPGQGVTEAPTMPALSAEPSLPVSDVTGPAITPIVTSSITFVVPRSSETWAEVGYPCYAAGATMSSGADGHPGAAFEKVSPLIAPAMAAAGIDLDTDLTAIGGFSCGSGPCLYVAARLATPGKLMDALKVVPGATVSDHGSGHYSLETVNDSGPRTIHLRVVPVTWAGGTAPVDPWAAWQATTTHVIFITGLMSGMKDVDPMTMILAPTAALAKVQAVEGVIPDAHGRCAIGTVAPSSDFKPGFALAGGRFVMAAPQGAGDALTRLLGSTRSVDVELELALEPAPKSRDVDRWVAEGRAWVANIAAPMRAQFAGQGPLVEAVLAMFALIGDQGFTAAVKGSTVTLSWRTDRVPQAALEQVERDLGAAGAVP